MKIVLNIDEKVYLIHDHGPSYVTLTYEMFFQITRRCFMNRLSFTFSLCGFQQL